VTVHFTSTWDLAIGFFAALGAWRALVRLNRLPTVRMLLALAAGTCGAVLVASWIIAASAWFGRLVASLPSPWPVILTAAPVAILAFGAVLVMFGTHPKASPDRSAETLAVSACAVLLFIAGAGAPVLQWFGGAR
jgi:DNA-binding transcriptional LysR family regulator